MFLREQLIKFIDHYFLLSDLIILSLLTCRWLNLLPFIGWSHISYFIIFTHYIIGIHSSHHLFHRAVLLKEVVCWLKIASELSYREHLTSCFSCCRPSLLLWLHDLILLGCRCRWLCLDWLLLFILFDSHEACYWCSLRWLYQWALNLRSDIILLIDFWSEWLTV